MYALRIRLLSHARVPFSVSFSMNAQHKQFVFLLHVQNVDLCRLDIVCRLEPSLPGKERSFCNTPPTIKARQHI